ncbi:MAG: hypothetical protein U0892_15020 [Pirellulales bacterium]
MRRKKSRLALLSVRKAVAQRIVRAKAKIRDAGFPTSPPWTNSPERLATVLRVMYYVQRRLLACKAIQ